MQQHKICASLLQTQRTQKHKHTVHSSEIYMLIFIQASGYSSRQNRKATVVHAGIVSFSVPRRRIPSARDHNLPGFLFCYLQNTRRLTTIRTHIAFYPRSRIRHHNANVIISVGIILIHADTKAYRRAVRPRVRKEIAHFLTSSCLFHSSPRALAATLKASS